MLNEVDYSGMIEDNQALAVGTSLEHGFHMGSERYMCMANLLELTKHLMKATKLTLGHAILHLLRKWVYLLEVLLKINKWECGRTCFDG